MAFDIYQAVTDRIISEMENGIIPWQKPWNGCPEGAYNRVTKRPYSFINQLLLKHADAYLTFKQVQEMGGKVKKGAKAEMVVFWKPMVKEELNDAGEPEQKTYFILRYYNVFWIGDTEGIPELETGVRENAPIETAEGYIEGYINSVNAPLFKNTEPSDKAYYSPSRDAVVVPMMDQYEHVEEYYSTVFHELTHSTGHFSRLDRGLERSAGFGSESYSKEELIAELGAAMLVNMAGIETTKSFRNSTAYLQNWLTVLRNDKKFIVSAASKAEKAVRYILGETGEKAA